MASHFAARVARRTRDLVTSGRFDVVVVQKESFPLGLERIFDWTRVPLVFDLDDAVYANASLPDGRGRVVSALADALLRREHALPALLRRCEEVVVGSPVLGRWASQHARSVRLIPTVVDTDAYANATPPRRDTPRIGWIGTPRNAQYLHALVPVFQRLAARHRFVLRVAGPMRFDAPGVEVACVGWRHYDGVDDEVADLSAIDIGVMPLPDTAFARGKCGFKLVQYMAAGRPVVASPVGVNAELVGDAGLLASQPEEWEQALGTLLADAALRARLGARGQARAAARYSLNATGPRWLEVLRDAARVGARGGRARRRPMSRDRGLVEPSGIEPPTSALRTRRSPN